MDSSKISIIVPIYNSEKDLNQCIESIVNQTYKNIEIILINDGSKDDSINIIKKWAKKDERIIVIDKKNEGVAKARNDGLDIATGDYIGFVDHDDYIEPTMYETMIKNMNEHNTDIVMCSSRGIYDNGQIKKSYIDYESFELNNKDLINRMLKYEKILCSSVWSKLYKRAIIENLKFDTEIILGDDYYFNGIAYTRTNKFFYNDEALYNYRIREGSISRRRVDSHFFDKYKVVDKLSGFYLKKGIREKKDFAELRFGITYEILYRLYIYGGDRDTKKKWKKVFKESAREYGVGSMRKRIKIFMMKHLTYLYVRLTH